MSEERETRLKRLRLRSWRRGIREMDLILGPFADGPLAGLNDAEVAAYERLLEAPDWEIFEWVTGAGRPPAEHAPLILRLASFHNRPKG